VVNRLSVAMPLTRLELRDERFVEIMDSSLAIHKNPRSVLVLSSIALVEARSWVIGMEAGIDAGSSKPDDF